MLLQAGVAKIGKQRAGGFVEDIEARLAGDVFGLAFGAELV
jgi:hypothetical protein